MGGRFHPKLNTGGRPIANKYRQGKLKRTLERESKALEIVEREANGIGHDLREIIHRGILPPRDGARKRPDPGARVSRGCARPGGRPASSRGVVGGVREGGWGFPPTRGLRTTPRGEDTDVRRQADGGAEDSSRALSPARQGCGRNGPIRPAFEHGPRSPTRMRAEGW